MSSRLHVQPPLGPHEKRVDAVSAQHAAAGMTSGVPFPLPNTPFAGIPSRPGIRATTPVAESQRSGAGQVSS